MSRYIYSFAYHYEVVNAHTHIIFGGEANEVVCVHIFHAATCLSLLEVGK